VRRLSFLLLLACVPTAAQEPGGSRTGLAEQLAAEPEEDYARAIAPRTFRFPDDHGPHPAFRNEWWYVTGNLDSDDGARFGYELTFFRVALTPDAIASDSGWRTNEIWFAHFALTDAGRNRFRFDERFARGAAGLAGARASPFRVWLDDWSIEESGDAWRLVAQAEDFAIDVRLRPSKPPVLNGDKGLSQKSAAPGNASYYYALTRLITEGQLRAGNDTHAVTGTSWLDREWSTSALGPDQVGWDWFALQVDDGSDLMIYQLRNKDGSVDRHSAGTLTDSDGNSRHLDVDDFTLNVTADWTNDQGDVYPAAWKLSVPSAGIKLEIEPMIADQELVTVVRYWEGAVDVSGTRNGAPLTGRGYVELTGYAH